MDTQLTAPPENSLMTLIGNNLSTLPVGFFTADHHGIIRCLDSEAARLIGYDCIEDVVGKSLFDIDINLECGLLDEFTSIQSGTVLRLKEHRCTNRRGNFAVIDVICGPLRQEKGDISGVFGFLHDVTESWKKKSDLEEAIFELSVMSQVSDALSSTADLDDVLKIILTGVTASQGLGFNRAFLFLVDSDGRNLEGKVAVGPSSPEEAGHIWSRLSGQPRALREILSNYTECEDSGKSSLTSQISMMHISLDSANIFSDVVKNGLGTLADKNDISNDESMEILTRLNSDCLALAPIISKGKRLGLIVADNQITGKEISPSVVDLLQTFANQTAVAIERSRLYDSQLERARELENINKQLAESQDQMIRVEKMSVIGELTSSIAHELRNPLTVIGGFANLLLTTGQLDGSSEYLNIILSEGKRAESVLHQVLDFSRASRTKTRLVELNSMVNTTYELLLSKLNRAQKPPKLNLIDGELKAWGNPDQLQHAILQFMLMTVEELTGECSVEFSTRRNKNKVRMYIEFTGNENARAKVVKTLKQMFGNPSGTQKLSILVAGETLKYHGGNYGVEGSKENLPRLYIELPEYKGGNNE